MNDEALFESSAQEMKGTHCVACSEYIEYKNYGLAEEGEYMCYIRYELFDREQQLG